MAHPSLDTSDDRIKGAGGLRLFVRSWRPNGKPWGVVAIIPGFNAHSGYYTWAGEQFASNGLAAYAVDLHGRGHSDGERFYVEKFADYVTDAAALVSHVKDREPGLPVFMLGHSAGGVVACTYTLDYPGELAGLICESFAHEIPAPDFVLAVFKGVSHLAPLLKGDPNKPGLYTIQLTIPPNTRIEAHTHPDDRVATVISGTWYIGYGDRFDEQKLKALTAGSFYTEPPNVTHFARTGTQGVAVQITGYGPTGTKYVNQ
jgi:alpha-beta hydrolase superfamily lysophospholipase